MDEKHLRRLLQAVSTGETAVNEALDKLKELPVADLGFARLDTHRALRNGFPEVVFCQGKTSAQVIAIMQRLAANGGRVMATRADDTLATDVLAAVPGTVYHPEARILVVGKAEGAEPASPGLSSQTCSCADPDARRFVLVVSAGTADQPVAEEAAVTAEIMGANVERLYDVGVAGLHRLLSRQELLHHAAVIVVAAGMDGALASVVAGLVDVPVVAVPTSIGYGASFHGLAALLSMLNACAAGVAVVNIDNGFGAGWMAVKISRSGGERQ